MIFLDEIQHVRSFEKVLSSLRATVNCSIFITGSNSKMLSGKMATLLVGRYIEFRIMPFSFSESYEYCKMQGKEISPDELFIDYINWGGLPLRFSFEREGDIKKYIEQTYQGILEKRLENVTIGNGSVTIGEYVFPGCADNLTISIAGENYTADSIKDGLK